MPTKVWEASTRLRSEERVKVNSFVISGSFERYVANKRAQQRSSLAVNTSSSLSPRLGRTTKKDRCAHSHTYMCNHLHEPY